jgi:hypothetical protein
MKVETKELKDLKAGDLVWCGGDSGFCDSGVEQIVKINTKSIVLSGKRRFDITTGKALNPPLAYYIKPLEEDPVKKQERFEVQSMWNIMYTFYKLSSKMQENVYFAIKDKINENRRSNGNKEI